MNHTPFALDLNTFEYAVNAIDDGNLFEQLGQDLLCQFEGETFTPVGGTKDKKLSVRLESTLLDAARRQSGIREDSALVAAGLALLARHNSFGTFLASLRGQLSDDFEIGL